MEITTDFLVLGSGIAGLSFAIKAADLGTVAIVTKKEKSESNTNLAQGGIAAVYDKADRFEYHINDTIAAGAGLCKEDVVRFVVMDGPERIKELLEWGVEFTRAGDDEPGHYDLGREGGHSMRRVLHARDLTGQEIERALHEKASLKRNIKIFENHIGIDLILESAITGRENGSRQKCLGAYILDTDRDQIHTFKAKFVILATGGSGKVYLITTTPDIATGDGVAMAYRAGAFIVHPVSSHLSIPPGSEILSHQRSLERGRRSLEIKRRIHFHGKISPHEESGTEGYCRQGHRYGTEEIR